MFNYQKKFYIVSISLARLGAAGKGVVLLFVARNTLLKINLFYIKGVLPFLRLPRKYWLENN
jgi:hypothetical protein